MSKSVVLLFFVVFLRFNVMFCQNITCIFSLRVQKYTRGYKNYILSVKARIQSFLFVINVPININYLFVIHIYEIIMNTNFVLFLFPLGYSQLFHFSLIKMIINFLRVLTSNVHCPYVLSRQKKCREWCALADPRDNEHYLYLTFNRITCRLNIVCEKIFFYQFFDNFQRYQSKFTMFMFIYFVSTQMNLVGKQS